MSDLRHAARTLARSPGFTISALLALALGIGANTAIFTVIDGVLLLPLPYPHAERIVVVNRLYKGDWYGGVSAAKYRFWKEHSRSFEAAAAVDMFGSGVNLAEPNETERVASTRVSPEYFRVFGIHPRFGRTFTVEEDRARGPCVAVITDRLLRMRLGNDSAILGRRLIMNGEPCIVIGIVPVIDRPVADIYTPMRIDGEPRNRENPFNMIARLKPGISLDQARAELATVFTGFKAANPDLIDENEVGIHLTRYLDFIVGDIRPSLWLLMGAVALVLLIACANVANLLLASATGRAKEMAVRAALGATRRRLVRQLITESLLIAIAGGVLGVLLAYFSVPVLLQFAPNRLPRPEDIAVDLRVAVFAMLLSGVTALLFGLAPALRSSRIDLNQSLKEGKASAGAVPVRARSVLIAAEVALCVMLLAGAGLLMRSFIALRDVSLGFDPHGVVVFRMSPGPRYGSTARLWEFERQALERVRAVVGVEAAATAMSVPLEPIPDFSVEILGHPERTFLDAKYLTASPDLFRILRIPLLRGRLFTENDRPSTARVAIINEALARQAFPDRDPLGEKIVIDAVGSARADGPRQIVGVVGDMRETGPDKPPEISVFVPRSQVPDAVTDIANHILPMAWVIRANSPSERIASAVKRAVLAIDAQQPISAYHAMDFVVSERMARHEFNLVLMSIFAAIAVLLAAIGIHGVVSYQVARRVRELGIRIALGATRADILRLVIRQAMIPVAVGVGAGMASALAVTRLIESMLFAVSARDPRTMAAIPLIVSAIALLGCIVPARRAAKIDPIIALRSE